MFLLTYSNYSLRMVLMLSPSPIRILTKKIEECLKVNGLRSGRINNFVDFSLKALFRAFDF